MHSRLNKKWVDFMKNESVLARLEVIIDKVESSRSKQNVFPKRSDVFKGLNMVDPELVKVVILGQDPYHGFNQANGLAFSVPEGVSIAPSLLNIYKELYNDIGMAMPAHGDLSCWAKQGVLLLNSVLSVVESKPGSHRNLGWEIITDEIILALSRSRTNLVFMLWGGFARSKRHLIETSNHLVLEAPHPSPLSAYRGFFGSKHFSQANAFLKRNDAEIIHWDCL